MTNPAEEAVQSVFEVKQNFPKGIDSAIDDRFDNVSLTKAFFNISIL